MKNNVPVVISAPSGAGKSTIIRRLLKEDSRLGFSVSTTTRRPRDGEVEGRDYYYISDDDFSKMREAGEFLEWAVVHGNCYGTAKKEVDRLAAAGKIPIFDVDIQGTKNLRNTIPDAVYIFIVPPSLQILEQRLKDRKTDSEEQIRIRLGNALKELREYRLYDYLVVNDQIEAAVVAIQSAIRAESHRLARMTDFIEKILEENNDHPIG
ncbi:MAG TPA: guanylate kinase [Spirochaetota bacterium]|nr:guanylate kinase [Spirochaetota bacterium]HRZ27167.1 guanylate kinase [Spirochaetota bacterium]HSA16384.1 guanylate kinase [Spirochaetota bacterium]